MTEWNLDMLLAAGLLGLIHGDDDNQKEFRKAMGVQNLILLDRLADVWNEETEEFDIVPKAVEICKDLLQKYGDKLK